MKKHLNTLYVTTQGAYLSKEGETVAVKVDNQTRLQPSWGRTKPIS
jgi:CRISPR-associated protein Cas1